MSEPPEIAAARIEVERSRARLMADVDAIVDLAHGMQHKLAPATLMRDAWEGAKGKGADLAEDAVDAVRSRPLATGGVVAAVTLFLAREPLMDLAARLLGSGKPQAKASKRRKVRSKHQDREDVE